MCELKEHMQISKDRIGTDGRKYHLWIDQFARYGYRHRQVLHHREGIEIAVLLFGEDARKHLELHIMTDYGSSGVPSIRSLRQKGRITDGLVLKGTTTWEDIEQRRNEDGKY